MYLFSMISEKTYFPSCAKGERVEIIKKNSNCRMHQIMWCILYIHFSSTLQVGHRPNYKLYTFLTLFAVPDEAFVLLCTPKLKAFKD